MYDGLNSGGERRGPLLAKHLAGYDGGNSGPRSTVRARVMAGPGSAECVKRWTGCVGPGGDWTVGPDGCEGGGWNSLWGPSAIIGVLLKWAAEWVADRRLSEEEDGEVWSWSVMGSTTSGGDMEQVKLRGQPRSTERWWVSSRRVVSVNGGLRLSVMERPVALMEGGPCMDGAERVRVELWWSPWWGLISVGPSSRGVGLVGRG